MKFNYAQARKEFEAEWAETDAICRSNNMPECDIEKLKETYLEIFNSDRRNYRYRAFGVDYFDLIANPDDRSDPYGTSLAVQYDFFDGHSRYWWLENISDARLSKKIQKLSVYEKELLTLKFKEQLTYQEMEVILHIPDSTLFDQVEKLKKQLRK